MVYLIVFTLVVACSYANKSLANDSDVQLHSRTEILQDGLQMKRNEASTDVVKMLQSIHDVDNVTEIIKIKPQKPQVKVQRDVNDAEEDVHRKEVKSKRKSDNNLAEVTDNYKIIYQAPPPLEPSHVHQPQLMPIIISTAVKPAQGEVKDGFSQLSTMLGAGVFVALAKMVQMLLNRMGCSTKKLNNDGEDSDEGKLRRRKRSSSQQDSNATELSTIKVQIINKRDEMPIN